MRVGGDASSSILLRSQEMCTSSVLVHPKHWGPEDLVHDPLPAQDLAGVGHQEVNSLNSRAAVSSDASSLVRVREVGSRRSAPISIGLF